MGYAMVLIKISQERIPRKITHNNVDLSTYIAMFTIQTAWLILINYEHNTDNK